MADSVAKVPKRSATTAKRLTERRSPIDVSSSAPPKLPVSSEPVGVVPRIIIQSPRLRPGKNVFTDAKRLLQHYRHLADGRVLAYVRFALPDLPQMWLLTHLGFRAPTQYVGSVPLLAGHSLPNARLRASVDVSFGDTRRRRQFIASLVTAKAFRFDSP